MQKISPEAKEAIIRKALNRDGKSMFSVAISNGVSRPTLYNWVRQYREMESSNNNAPVLQKSSKETNSYRFTHLMNTTNLDEESLGAYCRQHGIYRYQLEQWKDVFMNNLESKSSTTEKIKLKGLKAENKKLRQELRRKEKALAEASALLILKKKASLIWGEVEED